MTNSSQPPWDWPPSRSWGSRSWKPSRMRATSMSSISSSVWKTALPPRSPNPSTRARSICKVAFRGMTFSTMPSRLLPLPGRTEPSSLCQSPEWQTHIWLLSRAPSMRPVSLPTAVFNRQSGHRSLTRWEHEAIVEAHRLRMAQAGARRCASARACVSTPSAPSSLVRLEPFPPPRICEGAGRIEPADLVLQLQTGALYLWLVGLSCLLCDAQVAGSGRECINPNGIEK